VPVGPSHSCTESQPLMPLSPLVCRYTLIWQYHSSFSPGFKNGTDGSVTITVDTMCASEQPHAFMGVTEQGLYWVFIGSSSTTNLDLRARFDCADKWKQGRTHHPPWCQHQTELQVGVCKSSCSSKESPSRFALVYHGRLLACILASSSKSHNMTDRPYVHTQMEIPRKATITSPECSMIFARFVTAGLRILFAPLSAARGSLVVVAAPLLPTPLLPLLPLVPPAPAPSLVVTMPSTVPDDTPPLPALLPTAPPPQHVDLPMWDACMHPRTPPAIKRLTAGFEHH